MTSVATAGTGPAPGSPVSTGSHVAECLVCKGRLGPSRLPGLIQCTSCGFITANLAITDKELSDLYGRDYFHGQEYQDYVAESENLRLNFRRRIATLKQLAPDLASAELFEIGCAYGFFLNEIKSHVRTASGIDISADAIGHAVNEQKVDARAADYLADDLGRQVDVIAMWDTIEHLPRPDLFVGKAARDLKPGGLLAITTGDIGALNARLRGKSWRMIHPPTHLQYFSASTLSHLLTEQGFDVVHVSHPGNARKLRSVLYFIVALKANKPGLYNALQRLPLFNLNLTVNLFDIMYVVGRKRADGAKGVVTKGGVTA
jgi:2-polyprenyl-3-methyl-5-hydroxy-6-metoxy-1,4-benzoquinol methylase